VDVFKEYSLLTNSGYVERIFNSSHEWL